MKVYVATLIMMLLLLPLIASAQDDICFSNAVEYTVGSRPNSTCHADFDKDGDIDLATSNWTGYSITVLLNDGAGIFSNRTDYTVGINPHSIACGDINGDSYPDLVATHYYGNQTVTVLLNNGDGTYGSPAIYPTNTDPRNVTCADFNGDGFDDVAHPTGGGTTVCVFLSAGDGTLSPKVDYFCGSSVTGIFSADLDGDSDIDIAVANHLSLGTVAVLKNNGNGTFEAPSFFHVGDHPHQLCAADFNGDGYDDLAVPNHGSGNVSILLNQGNGTFAAHVDYPAGEGPTWAEGADFNGDGVVDLAVGHYNNSDISVLPGNGDGTFGLAETLTAAGTTYSLTCPDLNSDGKPDIAAVNENGSSISVFMNCGGQPQENRILLYTTRGTGTGLGVRRWDYDEDLVANLASEGFAVTCEDRETMPQLTAEILSQYDQLWFVSTESGPILTAGEVTAISDFHNAGKGIMIIGDSYTYDGPANQIGAGWGVQIVGQIDYCGGPVGCPISTTGFPSHEIWNGVSSIQANLNEGQLQVSAPATAIAVYNTINMVAVLDDGTGRVAWDGTYYRFTDVSCHPRISIADADNAQYVRNLANWLAGGGTPPEAYNHNLSSLNHVIWTVGAKDLIVDTIRNTSGQVAQDYTFQITLKVVAGSSFAHLDGSRDEDGTQDGIQITPNNGTLFIHLEADQTGWFVLVEASGPKLQPDTLLMYIGGYPYMQCTVRTDKDLLLPGDEVTYYIDFGNTGLAAAYNVVLIDSLYDPNLEYVTGSALVTGTGAHLEYSSDHGQTWQLNEPTLGLTHLKWVIPITAVTAGNPNAAEVRFKMKLVQNPYLGTTIYNKASIGAEYVEQTHAYHPVRIASGNERLLYEYAPILSLNPTSSFWPTEIEWLNGNCDLFRTSDNEELASDISVSVLGDYTEPTYPPRSVFLDIADTDKPADRLRVYGRMTSEDNRKVLQYWFFYPTNDWVNYHEGDWEMIQVVLHPYTSDADYAVYAQHNSKERANWADEVEYLAGTMHPVVYVADGSHASYFHSGTHPLQTHHVGIAIYTDAVSACVQLVNGLTELAIRVGVPASIAGAAATSVIEGIPLLCKGAAATAALLLSHGVPASVVTSGLNVATTGIARAFAFALRQAVTFDWQEFADGMATWMVKTQAWNEETINSAAAMFQSDITHAPSEQGLIFPDGVPSNVQPKRYSLTVIEDDAAWLQFTGNWGRVVKVLGMADNPVSSAFSGPLGPKYCDVNLPLNVNRWNHPVSWSNYYGISTQIEILLACPATLHVYDEVGRYAGPDRTYITDNIIPMSAFIPEGSVDGFPQTVVLSEPDTSYTIKIAATGDGEANLRVRMLFRGQPSDSADLQVVLDSGQVSIGRVTVTCREGSCWLDAPLIFDSTYDSTAPEISELQLIDSGPCETYAACTFRLIDFGVGVDRHSVRILLNGDTCDYSFNPATGYYTTFLPCGCWTLEVTAADLLRNFMSENVILCVLGYAKLCGIVKDDDNSCLLGVNVDVYDSLGNLWQTVVTDDSGYYHIDSIPNGDYTITVNTPLGYVADQETKEFTIHHVPVTVDFVLTQLDVPLSQRGRGYWMHQVNALLTGHGNPQETYADMCGYMELIRTHFNEHGLNPVNIFAVDLNADCDQRLQALRDVISPVPKSSMNDKARAHFTALLLNMVSGKLPQWVYISEDSATVSQAITYCNALIIDDNADNDEAAKNIAEMINEGQTIPAGMIDLATANYTYKQNESGTLPSAFALSQNYPNPFNPVTTISFSLPSATDVTLDIYNIMGQKITTLVNGPMEAGEYQIQWDGKIDGGQSTATGVYFYRLRAGEFLDTKKMLLLK